MGISPVTKTIENKNVMLNNVSTVFTLGAGLFVENWFADITYVLTVINILIFSNKTLLTHLHLLL